MQMHDIIMTTGLVLMVLSCLAVGIIKIKSSAWWGPSKSILAPLTKPEFKIVIYAGIN
jgi:hypothetical protein